MRCAAPTFPPLTIIPQVLLARHKLFLANRGGFLVLERLVRSRALFAQASGMSGECRQKTRSFETKGLWCRQSCTHWSLEIFAEIQGEIPEKSGKTPGAPCNLPCVVPAKKAGAVVFDSDLFHETDTIHFKPGYENRRINITLLFGRRQTQRP